MLKGLGMRICGLAVSAAALMTAQPASAQVVPVSPRVLEANYPKPLPGKAISQLGIGEWNYFWFEEPFNNIIKGTPPSYRAILSSGQSMTFDQLWAGGFIDKTTLLPTSLPAGANRIIGGIYRGGAETSSAAVAGTYVLDWEGDADLRLHWKVCASTADTNCQRTISANRIEAIFDASYPEYTVWDITRIGAGGLRNVRLYRKENEAALNSGKILDPRFQSHVRRYQVLRFVNPQQASIARRFRPGDFLSTAAATYAPDILAAPADAPRAINFNTIFKVAQETGTSAWIHVAGLPGAPASLDAFAGYPNNTPGVNQQAWLEGCRNNRDAILGSPDWRAYMDAIAQSLSTAGYPSRSRLYLEAWNEVWNTAQPWDRMTFCAKGVAETLGAGQDASYGYGYLAAHVMVQFDAALRRAGRRQAWTLALAQQAANTFTTTQALNGFKRYFTDRGVNPAPWLRYAGVSVQGYYFDSVNPFDGFITATSSAEHINKVRTAILSDPAGTDRARADWLINTNKVGSIPWAVGQRQAHQNIAVANGAYFLGDFEGESHDFLPNYLLTDPVIVNWAENFNIGAQGERVTRAWVAAMQAQNPNAISSNFLSIMVLDPQGQSPTDTKIEYPFYDGYYGESNGRTRGLEPLLRP
jgi:hypothetical protein